MSTTDLKLIETLNNKLNELSRKELGDSNYGYKIDQEMLQFISIRLKQTLGEIGPLDYSSVWAFLDFLSPYDQVMVEREFGG